MNDLALPSTQNASLPANYEAAKQSLREVTRIDECKSWSDKALALASYAKQASDDTMMKYARRIQLRAVKRIGELLQEIEPGQGKYQSKRDGAVPFDRKSAAESAGLSERQRKTALKLAKIPEGEFEAAVESENPPTVTDLTKPSEQEKFARDLIGENAWNDQEAFHCHTQLCGHIRDAIKQLNAALPMQRLVNTEKEGGKGYKLEPLLDELAAAIDTYKRG